MRACNGMQYARKTLAVRGPRARRDSLLFTSRKRQREPLVTHHLRNRPVAILVVRGVRYLVRA